MVELWDLQRVAYLAVVMAAPMEKLTDGCSAAMKADWTEWMKAAWTV